jgi:hypothetical protein
VFDEARQWYEIYDASDRVRWVVGPGGHGTPPVVREAIYDWMIRWLDVKGVTPKEDPIDLLPDHELLVTKNGQVEGKELFEIIRDVPRQKGTRDELAAFVRGLVDRNQPLLRSFRILPAEPGPAKQPVRVLVQESLTPGADARRALADGNVVVLVAPSGRGRDNERPLSGNWMNNTRAWLVGRNIAAMHAAEINAAVEAALRRADVDSSRISAHASGVTGVALLLAAASNPRITSVTLDRTPHSIRSAIEAPIHMNLHDAVIPGFAVKWDLADLRGLLPPQAVVWKDPTDWMGNVVRLEGAYTYSSSDPNVMR